LVEERRCAKPHPIRRIQAPISIKQKILKYLLSPFPRNIQVSSGQETCYCVSGKMMYPAFFSQLDHNRINKRIASFPLFPGVEVFLVCVPFNLFTYWIAFDFIKIGSEGSIEVEKLSPQ